MTVSVGPRLAYGTPLLGRDRELRALIERLDSALQGRGDCVAIVAEAGLGKTRLCEELARIGGERGFTTLFGHCLEGAASIPYLPFLDAIDAVSATPPPSNAGEADRQAVFAAVREELHRSTQRAPLLLLLEDVHWADASTILLLRHLVRFAASRRMLIVATCRPSDAGEGASPGTDRFLSDVQRHNATSVLALEELQPADAAALIEEMTGRQPPPSFCEALFARTGGNPLFIEQAVGHLLESASLFDDRDRWIELTSFDELPIPESARLLIEQRLARVDERSRHVLAIAALAGHAPDYDLVADVAGLEPEAFVTAVESAERAGILRVVAGGSGLQLVFAHDLIRQSIRDMTSLPRRRALHLQIAHAIERRYDTAGGDYDADLAYQYLQSGSREDAAKIVRLLESSAQRALAAAAFEEAARLYAEALAFVPANDASARCEMLLRLGEARKRVSDSDQAREAFESAAALARETNNSRQLARAALGFARSWPTVGSVDQQAADLLESALAVAPLNDHALRGALLARHALQLLYCGDPDLVLDRARDAVEHLRTSGDPLTLARALQVLHVAMWQPAHLLERLAVATEIVEIADRIGNPSVALWGIRPRIADRMELGDIASAAEDIAVYEAIASDNRQPIFLWQAAVRRAMFSIFNGRLDEGERMAQKALDLGRQAEGQNLVAAFGGQLLVIRWLQGRAPELDGLIRASHEQEPDVMLWAAVLAFIEVEAGNTAAARAVFDVLAADRFSSLRQEDTRLVVLVLASTVCSALGDAIRADQLYDHLLPYEGRNIVVSEGVACVGAASLYLGMLAMTSRRFDHAERHLEDAIGFNERTGGRPWLSLSQHELARLLLVRRRSGDRKRAADLLRSALGIARDTGMRGLQERIEHVMRTHRRLSPDRPDGLTGRELEVLALVAGGLTTRQISERLVLSPRTTSRHLTNVYAKIGARNRVEATNYALAHGLAG